MSNPNDPKSFRNPVPRPQMSVQDAMRGSGFDTQFNEKNMPGNVDEASMLNLLAQNTELKPSARAPSDVQAAIQEGRRENPESEDYRGRVEFGNQDPNYRPAPAPSRDFSEPPSRESFRSPNPNPNPNADRRQVPAAPGVLPDHIRQKMADIDRAQQDPEGYRRDREARDQRENQTGLQQRYADEEWEQDSEELNNGFDRLDADQIENRDGRVSRSPRLPPRRKPPITNQPDGPRRQPQISEAERDAVIRARGDNASERQFTPTKPRFILNRIQGKGAFVRFTPTSGGVFYKGADNLQVRKFNLTDAMNIQKAKENQDITTQIDVIQESMGDTFDVRDLTMGDMMQIHYWHRFNSYQTIPFILNWTSKYGNKAQYRLTETEVQYKTMEISEEDLQPWIEQGYTVPRVRDFEMFSREELTSEEQYIVNRAQFFIGNPRADGLPPDIQDKIDMMMEKTNESLDAVAKITEFGRLTEHGVIERVMLKDSQFDREKHVGNLRSRHDVLQRQIDRLAMETDDNSVRQLLALEMEADEIDDEIQKWEDEGAAAEVEDVTLNIPLLNFFPTV